ncbi:DeoR/GlpR family DNA-binding transcription regulator [Falsibacillus albus]|uniref:DeoR/GlpR transcriptional regulator n=1 Tax=Falsibacillus albus TaxID=2478915 RepID=A0A3L7JZ08_9BACI|nr:DeoR/GlpR family DNA-binding transcription regulator [Falsibacillus albus]RLQ95359.1 DeoR/GlpR transcriptional regulator [Falsibacillus albus]
MLTEERQTLILDLLKQKDVVKIQEIIDLTNASESTIRRDLTQLEELKFLKRVHGGASRLQGKLNELSVTEKTFKNHHEKQLIAKKACSLIEKGDCIYLDAGTTTLQMIDHLPDLEIVVVTNGLQHVGQLVKKGFKTYLIGGYVKPKTNAMIGKGAVNSLKEYRFDKAFMGANGIHPDSGYTTPDPEEAFVKNSAMELAREAFVLADHSKLGEISFAKIADLNKACLVTDEHDEDLRSYQRKTMVKVVTS